MVSNVLTERQVGREKLFIHPKLMTLLASDEHVVPHYPPMTRGA